MDSLSVRPICQPAPDHPSYSGSSTSSPAFGPLPITWMWQWCMPQALHWCPAVVEARAELGGLPRRHVHRRQVRRVVLDRQDAQLVQVGDAGKRSPAVERRGRRIRLEIVRDIVRRLDEPARVMGRERLGAAHDAHGLELLLAHDGAAAVLGGDVTVVALDRREADEVLAGGADRVDGEPVPRERVLGLERLLGLPGVLALEVRGVADLHDVVVDVEIGELLGLALDHDGVIARVLERGAEEAVGLGRGRAVGLRAARDHGQPARAPDRQPRQRARGEDEPVVRMVPVDLGADFFVEDLRAETDAAEILAHVLSPGLVQIFPVERLTRSSLPAYPGTEAGAGAAFLAGRVAVAVGLIGPSPSGEAGVIGRPARGPSAAEASRPCGSRGRRA